MAVRPSSPTAGASPNVFRPAVRLAGVISAALLLFSTLMTADLRGAVPSLDGFFPAAAQVGTTQAVTAIGKFEPWPVQVWSDTPGLAWKVETNKPELKVAIPADAPLGPHFVRLYNDQGASAPKCFVVTKEPQVAEVEPNDTWSSPQALDSLPVSLNGRLEKSGDVDCFAVTLGRGQTLVASVEAYVLSSPLDAVLRVVDARGVEVSWNHDDGRTLDPFLAYTAPAAGRYVVQVFGFAYPADSDVRFTGNAKCVYRLHLTAGPFVRHTIPLGVARHGRSHLQLVGWNLGTNDVLEFDPASLDSSAREVLLRDPRFGNAPALLVGEGRELVEPAGEAKAGAEPRWEPPFAVTGRLDKAGEEDRYRVTVKKGELLRLELQSAAFGFPLDAWLKIENQDGKELKRADDSGGPDPAMDWTAPEDGTFVVAVGNVLHRGGPDHYYRVSVAKALPAIRVTVASDALVLDRGKTNDLKCSVQLRNGANAKLSASLRGLPRELTEGTNAAALPVPEKGGDVVFKLSIPAEAKPWSGPFQIVVTEAGSGTEHRAVRELVVLGENNGVPNGFSHLLLESIDQLWLTLPPAPEPKTAAAK
jgi:hypothetical protein